ncbi:MAG TPA: hypothetical protein EYQ64_06425 [Gemmatimonadetes bacterium]|nr:hypothetical protein [Gemmatimonadota bacterium]
MAEVLGGFEHSVLLAIMRLDSSAYSVPIVLELEKQTGRSVAPAAVYVTQGVTRQLTLESDQNPIVGSD